MRFRENDQSDKRLDWEIIVFPEHDFSCSEMIINPLQNSTFWKSETAFRKRYYIKSRVAHFGRGGPPIYLSNFRRSGESGTSTRSDEGILAGSGPGPWKGRGSFSL